MKFSLWTNYGALNSKPVFDAFARGAKSLGYNVVWNDPNGDVDVIWSVLWSGRMAANKSIWERNLAQSKPTVVLEVGGIRRGTTWKVGLNGINRDAYFGDMGNDSSRASLLSLEVKDWTNKGEYILIAGQHTQSLQWQNMPSVAQWTKNTITTIRKYSKRPIILRPHPRCPMPNVEAGFKDVIRQRPTKIPGTYDDYDIKYKNIWATVSWSSNPGIHSILKGVPSFVSTSSLAYDAANDIDFLHDIENPYKPDRTQWLNDYAWTEFTVEEIASGLPLKRLTSKLI